MNMNKNRYRVEGFDSFSHEEFHVGSYDTKEEAIDTAKRKSGEMTLMYVHDPQGKVIYRAGSF